MVTILVNTTLQQTGNGAEAIPVPLVLRPLSSKLNPLWWFDNDERTAVGNTFVYKYLRNFMQNFRWYVIGVADRPHSVTGRYGNSDLPIPAKRSDLHPPESGWQYSVIWVFGLPLLPWISFASRHFTFYLGWEPAGGFGILLNFSNSDLA